MTSSVSNAGFARRIVFPRWWIVGMAGLALGAVPALAQPDMSRPAPETIADHGSAYYRFESVVLPSVDGERRYRLRIGIPRRPPPRQGYPVIWLLDGKAALPFVDEGLLRDLDGARPPVIVALAHDTPLRLDGFERVLDYTPGEGSVDGRGRRGGGADALLSLMVGAMTERVAALAPIDRREQTIWGHSLGGLFVLHALIDRPGLFRRYYAASPSLWWHDGEIRRALARRSPRLRCACRLIVGEDVGESGDPHSGRHVQLQERTAAVARPFYDEMARIPALSFERRPFPGLGHGGTLGATVAPALRLAAGLEP